MQGGAFTYGNRIALGMIFNDTKQSEYKQLKAAHKELYGYSCRWLLPRPRYKRLMAIAEGLGQWCKIEQQELQYTPSADEIAAGIEDLQKKIGHLSTVGALAEKFSKDPDEILRWSYSKVFGLLRKELLNSKFQERYNKIVSRKNGAGKKYHK